MTQEPAPPSKRDCLADLLDKGMVQILLDSRCAGVALPTEFEGNLELRLNLSYRFGLPIELDEWGVHATLTFAQVPHDCKIPWKAIYSIISYATDEPFLFPEDVPLEVMLAAEADEENEQDATTHAPAAMPAPQPALAVEEPPAPERPRPTLSLVEADDDVPTEADEPSPTPATSESPADSSDEVPTDEAPRSRAHLRVVK